MASNIEVAQIDWVLGLYDVMGNVSANLNLKDLRTLNQVCISWREAALREKSKRSYIQPARLVFPMKLKFDMLHVKPYAAMLIYENDVEESVALHTPTLRKPNYFALDYFDEQLPEKVIALKVRKYLTTQVQELDSVKEQRKINPPDSCDLLGLFIPNIKRRAQVRVAWEPTGAVLSNIHERANYLARELGLRYSKRSKSALLIFTHSRQAFEVMNELIRNRVDEKTETVWSGMFQEKMMMVRCNREDFRSNRGLVAIRISGPSVNSWSINMDALLPQNEIEDRLQELKGRVTRGRHCTGLFYAPAITAYGECDEFMSNIRRIFPDITFVGLFNSKLWSGADKFFETPDDNFYIAMNQISIIIISYD